MPMVGCARTASSIHGKAESRESSDGNGGEKQKCSGERARMQMLIDDEERRAGDRHGEQCGDKTDSRPMRRRFAKASSK